MPDSLGQPLLEVRDLVQVFSWRQPGGRFMPWEAISRVTFSVSRREIFGIIGESGSGKSTLSRALLQLPRPTSGAVVVDGHDLTRLRGRELMRKRRLLQIIFQDSFGSLDPTWCVSDLVEEPLLGQWHAASGHRRKRVEAALEAVGLSVARTADRKPYELSGGECQRVAIARALVAEPSLLICDEAVSSLDNLTRAEILGLLKALQSGFGLSVIFISHDLLDVERLCHRVAVLFRGQLCEIAPTKQLFTAPRHHYTAALVRTSMEGLSRDSLLDAHSQEVEETGMPTELGGGCRYRRRCAAAQPICEEQAPALREVGDRHAVACHFPRAT